MALKQYDDATHVVLTREDFAKLSEAVKSGKIAKKKLTAIAADLKVILELKHLLDDPSAVVGLLTNPEEQEKIKEKLFALPGLIDEIEVETKKEDA